MNQASPAALLHIKGSENSWDKHIRLEDHDTTNYGAILYDSGGMKFRTFEASDAFYFRNDSNTTNMIITDAGDVGIGTSSPTGTLTVTSSGHDMIHLNRTVDNEGYGMGIIGRAGNDASTTAAHEYAAMFFQIEDHTDGAEKGAISFNVSTGGTAADQGSTHAMQITSDGYVGIGTTTPETLLDLDDSTYPKMRFSRGTSYWWEIGHTSSDFRFTSQTGGTIMHMNYDGNVGIGTESPAGKFGVQLADATGNGNVLNWDNTYALFGDAGAVGGEAVGIGFGTAGGVLVCLDPGSAWEPMNYMAGSHTFKDATTTIMTLDSGSVDVVGDFSATTKSFVITHPTKPGKTLRHGSLEGPEHGVYVRGKLERDNVIELPDYWPDLVDDDSITVQLTANKSFQQLYVEKIEDNKVYVKEMTDRLINCFYFIQAERKDIEKMIVESDA